jgi:hypothetical protein
MLLRLLNERELPLPVVVAQEETRKILMFFADRYRRDVFNMQYVAIKLFTTQSIRIIAEFIKKT